MNFFKNMRWSPKDYSDAAFLFREIGEEMIARLDLINIAPQLIVEMGCGLGEGSVSLQKRYPNATVLAVDLSLPMLQHGKEGEKFDPHPFYLCADAGKIPLADHSVDFIFSNFLLPWHEEEKVLLREWRRLLRPEGLLLFTTFGLDTMKEWQTEQQIPRVVDMHDLGDFLLQAGFADPVMDVDYYTVSYQDQEKLFRELLGSGMIVSLPEQKIISQITYEIIFSHAFAPLPPPAKKSESGEIKIPVSSVKRGF